MRQIILLGALFLFGATAGANQHAPRVLSPHVADTYSMKTFAQFPRWRDLTGDAKVYEIYSYLVDPQTGLHPMGVAAFEGRDAHIDFAAVRDPVKALNVYTAGFCGTLGPTMAGIMEQMGIGPARSVFMPKLSHVFAEVFYDDAWHYLDLDLRAVFRRPDGSLASFQDARSDRSLWEGPHGPLFFPFGRLEDLRAVYEREENVSHFYGFPTGGHTMNYVLRRGETLTRWWRPQQGRWNHHPAYSTGFARTLIEREPRGPKSKHADWSVYTYGNGRFDYRPDLTSQSRDFQDGVYDFRNVRPAASGLTLREPGEGYAIFEVRSPYVIVPLVGDLDTPDDQREASIVKIEGDGVALDVSTDNGLSWQSVGEAGTYDLTRQASGRYGYLLKVMLRGQSGSAVLRSLEITTWVQLNPVSLPALRQGRNAMQYVTGDHHGLNTHVVEIRTESSDDFLTHLVEPPADFDPAARPLGRAIGPFVAIVAAPPGMRIAWFSAGGSFRTHQGGWLERTNNTMAWAPNQPRDFTEFYRTQLPPDQGHWHYNVDVEVKLEEPAPAVYIRYVADPAVNHLRIYAHCLPDQPSLPSPMVITHGWRERGEPKTKTIQLEEPGGYEIVCDEEPENEYIQFSVPSSRGSSGDAAAERP